MLKVTEWMVNERLMHYKGMWFMHNSGEVQLSVSLSFRALN